jgi:hypothetical protein
MVKIIGGDDCIDESQGQSARLECRNWEPAPGFTFWQKWLSFLDCLVPKEAVLLKSAPMTAELHLESLGDFPNGTATKCWAAFTIVRLGDC